MPLPSYYFHPKARRAKKYHANPPGQLSVTRMAQSRAAWQDLSNVTVDTTKTLVLSDWTAKLWDDETLKAYKTKLQSLLEHAPPFTLYILQEGEPQKMNLDSLDLLDDIEVRKKITPLSQKAIQQKMAKHDISKSSLLVLDTHELQQLREEKTLPLVLNVEDVMTSKFPIFDIIASHQHQRVNIPLGSFTKQHADMQRFLLKHLDGIGSYELNELLLSKDFSLVVGNNFLTNEIKKSITKASIISEYGLKITPELLLSMVGPIEKIRSLTLQNMDDLEWRNGLSDFVKSLKAMAADPQKPFNLTHLTHLDCTGSEFTLKDLNILLTDTALTSLDLSHCTDLRSAPSTPPKPSLYSQLKTLNLYHTDMDLETLHIILKENERIETLTLSRCIKGLGSLATTPFHLPQLKTLSIGHSGCKPEHLSVLLHDTQNLKDLTIDNLFLQHLTEADLVTLAPHLASLETLRVMGVDQAAPNFNEKLCQLLTCCPHLSNVKIDIEDTSIVPLQILMQEKGLRSLTLNANAKENSLSFSEKDIANAHALETLHLSKAVISPDSLIKLLSAVPYLTQLHLDDVQTGPLVFPTDTVRLSELRHCHLSGHYDGKLCEAVLIHTHHLETLHLEKIKFAPDVLKRLHLSELKHLSIKQIIPIPEQLDFLLQCTKLQTLTLQHILPDDATALFSSPPYWPDLKSLTLQHAINIKPSDFEAFMQNTPNLSSLALSSVSFPTTRHRFKLSLPHLTALKLEGSRIHVETLCSILASTPNLRTLTICHILIIGDSDITDMPKLTALTTLNLRYSEKAVIPLTFVKKLIENSPNLLSIKFDGLVEGYLDEECIAMIKARRISVDPESLLDPTRASAASTHSHKSGKASAKKTYKPPHNELLDADTTFDKNTAIKTQRFFFSPDGKKHPAVNYDRVSLYDTFQINPAPCPPQGAFTLHPVQVTHSDIRPVSVSYSENVYRDAQKQSVMRTSKKGPQCFVGRHKLSLTQSWQALPSLSPNERMLSFQANTEDIEIAYCDKTNLYYIRGSQAYQSVDFQWLIETPTPSSAPLPEQIQSLIERCRDFGEGELLLPEVSEPTGNDYLDLLIKQKKGACRHRALVFKHLMEKRFPKIPVRIVYNDCHAFIEIQYEGIWQSHCLGGYPANLEINENNHPDPTLDAPKVVRTQLTETASTIDLSPYQAHFEPWVKRSSSHKTPTDLVRTLLSTDSPKTLLDMPVESITALQAEIIKEATRCNRPIYIINHPDDLVCSAPFIKSENGKTGEICDTEQGGPLHDILIKLTDPPPLIIVNYTAFSDEETVRANPLLDVPPFADGTPLPEGTQIIGLTDTSRPDSYDGADFFSRFSKKQATNLPLEDFDTVAEAAKKTPSEEENIINLFNAPDWRERLMGRWTLKGQRLVFEEGALIKACRVGKPIIIANAPWHTNEFQLFWQTLQIKKSMDGIDFSSLPPIYQTKGYNWSHYKTFLSIDAHDATLTLNPSTLPRFLTQPIIDVATKGLRQGDGLLKQHQGKTLKITLSRELSLDEWGMLLEEATKHQVTLSISPLPGVTLPLELGNTPDKKAKASPYITDTPLSEAAGIIHSTDIDYTIANLKTQHPNGVIIDITELDPSEIIGTLKGQYNHAKKCFEFEHKPGLLEQASLQGKKLILKGELSDEMLDVLTPMLLEKTSQITLVTAPTELTKGLNKLTHEVTTSEKKAYLALNYPKHYQLLPDPLIEKEALSSLVSRLNHLRHHPGDSTLGEETWIGMESLPPKRPLTACDISNESAIQQSVDVFQAGREHAVNTILHTEPFVVITGATGVGKSSFVTRRLNDANTILHQGEKSIQAWALDKTPGKRKILFIDEANITSNSWNRFEGLYEIPPHIIIDGQLHELDADHKVVFAMNPKSYGDERETPQLFQRHGNAVLFEPLHLAFIYQVILLPLFENTLLNTRYPGAKQAISQTLLNAYQFFANISHEKVLMTPRELKMIGMLVFSQFEKDPTQDPILLTQHYLRLIADSNVPSQHRRTFDAQFPPQAPLSRKTKPAGRADSKTDFIITASREHLNDALDDFLTLRTFRREARETPLNNTQAYGGLGAFVLEGEPGIGKTKLVKQKLERLGFKLHTDPDVTLEDNIVFHIPVTTPSDQIETLLRQAFDAGGIVVIDEMSSLRSLKEGLLNALLMGETPEGNTPKKPGFMLIGTQNPISMAGRKAMSHALQRRAFSMDIPPYTKEEMLSILMQSKNIEPGLAMLLVDAYSLQRLKAEKEHLNPIPCFRDLLDTVDQHYAPKAAPTTKRVEVAGAAKGGMFEPKKGLPQVDKKSTAAKEQLPQVEQKIIDGKRSK